MAGVGYAVKRFDGAAFVGGSGRERAFPLQGGIIVVDCGTTEYPSAAWFVSPKK